MSSVLPRVRRIERGERLPETFVRFARDLSQFEVALDDSERAMGSIAATTEDEGPVS